MIEKIEVTTSDVCIGIERKVSDIVSEYQREGLQVDIQYSYAYSDLEGSQYSAMIIGRKK